MGLFGDILKSGESLFRNEDALDTHFIPKNLPYRENQHQQIANAIRPLLLGRTGRNLLITGPPGIGKTAAIKWVFRELEEESDDVHSIYINCWQKNTTYQIYVDILHQLGYSFTQNKRSEELLDVIKNILNTNKAAVFCFDEIDKTTDYDFLYSLLTEIYRRSIILITNYPQWLLNIEDRIRSRLLPETVHFRGYNKEETSGIIQQRIGFAFVPGVWTAPAQSLIVDATCAKEDIRVSLYLLREAGLIAEDSGSRRVLIEHAEKAVQRLASSTVNPKIERLDETLRNILELVKDNPGEKIGELYKQHLDQGGQGTYKTFQRRIEKLRKDGLINAKKVTGKEGNTTLLSYADK